MLGLPTDRYLKGEYLRNNPTWDVEDSFWKAQRAIDLLKAAGCQVHSICEVGCGAGGVLAECRRAFPEADLFGYDIAPDAGRFWTRHVWADISFEAGDFFELNQRHYDALLLLDVIEHVEHPFDFLRRLRKYAYTFVFHIPLDLSAVNILRESSLLRARIKVGHIHYFTKHLALDLVKDCGYQVLKCHYTGATFTSPRRNWKSKLAALPRRLTYSVNKDFGLRVLGGETLMILAKARNESGS